MILISSDTWDQINNLLIPLSQIKRLLKEAADDFSLKMLEIQRHPVCVRATCFVSERRGSGSIERFTEDVSNSPMW